MMLVILAVALVGLFLCLFYLYSDMVELKAVGNDPAADRPSISHLLGVVRMSLFLVVVVLICLMLIQ